VTNATIAARTPTQNVWVRAKDSLNHWSSAVALPLVRTAYVGSTLTATASAMVDITAIQFGFTAANATTPPGAFSTIAGASGPSPVSTALPATPTGQMMWVRASDAQGNTGPVLALPVATNGSGSANPTFAAGFLSGVARAGANGTGIGSIQYIRAAAGPSTTPPPDSAVWLSTVPSSGTSPQSFTKSAISGGGSTDGNGHIWVRVQDANGNWGPAVRL
jgi:hypothetical protein